MSVSFNPASPSVVPNPSANSWPTFYSNVAATHRGQQDSPLNFKKVLPDIATMEELRTDLCYCPNRVLLVVAAPFFKVRYLHQFHWDRPHPTLPGASNDSWALMGVDDNPPAVLVPWHEIAKKPSSAVPCPEFSSLIACVDGEGIKTTAASAATADATTASTYNGKFGVILPPVITTLLLQSDNDDPAEVCVLVGRAIKEADTQFHQLAYGNAPVPSYAPTPYHDHCQHIVHFLWWAATEDTSFPGAVSLFPVQGTGI